MNPWMPAPAHAFEDKRLKEAVRKLVDDSLSKTVPKMLSVQ
jgi:hypothetical protein